MTKVIGVRFRTAGKIYFFDPLQFEIKRGDHVIVETARGIEFGTVVSGVSEVEDEKVVQPLKPVIRIANQRDMEQEAGNKEKEKEAYKICLEKIQKHGLEMKLIDAEYTFDNNKVLFYFTADGRIDFRELVKDLASVFKTRIELRQIGVRDETKIVGGIGICGRPLCCHSYLSDFVPVSIKMAKEQNLSLNPTKISGVCGRLMCCLKNEEETYEELNRRLPGIGDYVTTDDGLKGEVQSVNVLRQLVKVVVDVGDEKEIREYEVDRLAFKRRHGKRENVELSKEELKELERLEEEEAQEIQESGDRHENGQRRGNHRQDRQQEDSRQEGGQRRNGRRQDGQQESRFQGNNQRRGGHRQDDSCQENGRQRSNPEGQSEGAYRENSQHHGNHESQPENSNRENGQHRGDHEGQSEVTYPESSRYRGNHEGQSENSYQENDQHRGNREGQSEGFHQDNGQHRDGRENQHRDGQSRQDNRQRQYNRQRQDNRRQDGHRQDGYQRRDNREGQHRDGQDNRQRQYNRQRQDSHRQDGQRQDGYQRRDYKPRYRHDTRPRQEGRSRQDDSQS